jgi:hypothetical protein
MQAKARILQSADLCRSFLEKFFDSRGVFSGSVKCLFLRKKAPCTPAEVI